MAYWLAMHCRGPSFPIYAIGIFHNLFSIIFVCFLIICFMFFCFILIWIFIWTNTVRTEVAKTAKRANYIAFLFLCSFVVPSDVVGKYKEQRLTDKIGLITPTIIIPIHQFISLPGGTSWSPNSGFKQPAVNPSGRSILWVSWLTRLSHRTH